MLGVIKGLLTTAGLRVLLVAFLATVIAVVVIGGLVGLSLGIVLVALALPPVLILMVALLFTRFVHTA